MLTFAFVLALVSVAFETMIASRSRPLRRAAGRRVTVNLGISLALSVALGVLFGAVGLVALTAGLMSTVLAIPVYRFLHWNLDSPQAMSEGGNRIRFWIDRWMTTSRRLVSNGRMFASKSWRVVSTPFAMMLRFRRFLGDRRQ